MQLGNIQGYYSTFQPVDGALSPADELHADWHHWHLLIAVNGIQDATTKTGLRITCEEAENWNKSAEEEEAKLYCNAVEEMLMLMLSVLAGCVNRYLFANILAISMLQHINYNVFPACSSAAKQPPIIAALIWGLNQESEWQSESDKDHIFGFVTVNVNNKNQIYLLEAKKCFLLNNVSRRKPLTHLQWHQTWTWQPAATQCEVQAVQALIINL